MKAVYSETRRLLQIMRDDGDRVMLGQIVDQLLDFPSRDRIKGGGRLIEQDHFRVDRDGARNAQRPHYLKIDEGLAAASAA